jgi:DNA processing protein
LAKECTYLTALHEGKDIGWDTIHRVLVRWGRVSLAATLTVEELIGELGVSASRAVKLHEALRRVEETAERMEQYRKKGIHVVTWMDEAGYPPLLRQSSRPPWVLYAQGDLAALELPKIALVGTRRATPYGRRVAADLARELAGVGWTVASGLARGIDSAAHVGAIEVPGGRTVAVLGAGLDHVYPAENRGLAQRIRREGGLLLTEMPPHITPKPGLFPLRNRIIAGLCHGTVVVEAAGRSGSLITADLAMQESREVFAVPGPITSRQSEGPLELIAQGAKLVRNGRDILDEFSWFTPPVPGLGASSPALPFLTPMESKLLEQVGMEPLHFDQLLSIGTFSLADLHTLLLSLQMKKRIVQLPGSSYVRI